MNLVPKATVHGRIISVAAVIAGSGTQLGLIQVATLLGEISPATVTSVTATLSMANISRGGKVAHEAATDESVTNAIGPDVGRMATALAPRTGFETIGEA